MNNEPEKDLGPPILENWRAMQNGQASLGAFEYPLFTDAIVDGAAEAGPYRILNTGAAGSGEKLRAAAVLRVEYHVNPKDIGDRSLERTDDSAHHGGSLEDELAALTSLAAGIRLRAGGISRVFRRGDARGEPVSDTRQPPTLLVDYDIRPAISPADRILPSVQGLHNLEISALLNTVGAIDQQTAVALIRSARMYQDAIWVAESQPNLTWLLLVSALETAANHWRREQDAPIRRLEASMPDLYELLVLTGGTEHADAVAERIADSLGAGRKFRDFVIVHLPGPPEKRPPKPHQFEWTEQRIKKMLTVVYGYRSKALHTGKPFPEPLCQSSWMQHNWGAPAERTVFSATRVGSGVWHAKDLPISLDVFAHLTRGALIKWWQSLAA